MPFRTRRALAAVSLAAAVVCAPLYALAQTDVGAQLDQILASDHRNPKNAARDQFRHPKEGLMFFGIQPDMTVVEVWPSGGWWTEILAPLLRDRGTYNAAWYATPSKNTPDYARRIEKGFDEMVAARPDLYGKITKTYLLAPEFVDIAPKGSVDMVLTFRNVHNWAKAGNAPAMFQVFYDGSSRAACSASSIIGRAWNLVREPDQQRLHDRAVRDRYGPEGGVQAGGTLRGQCQPERHQGPSAKGCGHCRRPWRWATRTAPSTWRSARATA